MHSHATDLTRLCLLLERLRDADTLLAQDSAALLAQAAQARRSLAEGDLEAPRQHVARLAGLTEALVQTDALDLADGRALLETARRLLEENAC
jgi:hypothetical protein